MAAIIKLESEWMSEVFLCKWWEPILASMSEFERKYYDGWIQDGGIQDGRIQDSCHHQVKWEWMSLNQIELVWVRVRVEWESFWVNLREDNKVSESKMAVAESNMAEFKMTAIIKLSQNEWVWVRMKFFCVRIRVEWDQSWQVKSEFEETRCLNPRRQWLNPRWPEFKMAAIITVEWEWISLSQIEIVWVRVLLNPKWLNPRWQNSRWLPSSS